jgi:predicted RNase H-like nuclease (RuvC/YqgF family)
MIAMEINPWISGIISFVFGGGLVTAIVALYKVRPESGQIVVTAAQGALLVQSGVIENLQKEIQRLTEEVNALKIKLNERDQLILQLQGQLLDVKNNQSRHDTEIKEHMRQYPVDSGKAGSAK